MSSDGALKVTRRGVSRRAMGFEMHGAWQVQQLLAPSNGALAALLPARRAPWLPPLAQPGPFISLLLPSSLELSDTKVYEPLIRALLGTTASICEVVVPKLRAVVSPFKDLIPSCKPRHPTLEPEPCTINAEPEITRLQGHLAHSKTPPPMTLQ